MNSNIKDPDNFNSRTSASNRDDRDSRDNRVQFLDSGHLDITADVIQLSNDPPTANVTPILSNETDSALNEPTEFSFIHTLNLLIFNSFLGTLLRLSLDLLFTYKDQQVFSLIYAQLIGCFIFGFLKNTQKTLLKNNLNLFIGFGTGLCGCITTFSSFMLHAFTNLFHIQNNLSVLKGILSAITICVVTLTASSASLRYGHLLGRHFNDYFLERKSRRLDQNTNSNLKTSESEVIINDCFIRYILLFLVSVVPWSVIIVTSIWIPQGRGWTISLALSPLGTLLRMLLRRLNALSPTFFWGTFTANILGTGILGLLFILQQPKLGICIADSSWKCELLFGFSNGFCACLTTISGFMSELNQLNTRKSHQYGLISILCAQIILLIIIGSWYWTAAIN